MLSLEDVTAIIRTEVAKHTFGAQFLDSADLIRDLDIDNDDLSQIASDLERRFRVKLNRHQYAQITTVKDWAEALYAQISANEVRS